MAVRNPTLELKAFQYYWIVILRTTEERLIFAAEYCLVILFLLNLSAVVFEERLEEGVLMHPKGLTPITGVINKC